MEHEAELFGPKSDRRVLFAVRFPGFRIEARWAADALCTFFAEQPGMFVEWANGRWVAHFAPMSAYGPATVWERTRRRWCLVAGVAVAIPPGGLLVRGGGGSLLLFDSGQLAGRAAGEMVG